MPKKELTDRQAEVLGFIKEFILKSGYPPSLRDICARFCIKGPQNARKHLDALEKKGFIRRALRSSRAIEVLGEALNGGGDIFNAPVAGRVRAGVPHLAIEDITGHVALDRGFFPCDGAFLLKVEGDSMTGAGIDDGDHVLVRPQKDASNGEIVVASIDGEATVKRFFRKEGSIILKPENPRLEPIEAGPEEDFSMIGKVVSVIKRF